MRNGKRPRENDDGLATGTAWESHVDKKPRSDTSNFEDDRRQQREAELSRVPPPLLSSLLTDFVCHLLTAAMLTTELGLGSPSTSSAC